MKQVLQWVGSALGAIAVLLPTLLAPRAAHGDCAVYVFHTKPDTHLWGARIDGQWTMRRDEDVSKDPGWSGNLAYSDGYLYRRGEDRELRRVPVNHLQLAGKSELVYDDIPAGVAFAVSAGYLYYISDHNLHVRRIGDRHDTVVEHGTGQWGGQIAAADHYLYRVDDNRCYVYWIDGDSVVPLGNQPYPNHGMISFWNRNGVLYHENGYELRGNAINSPSITKQDTHIDGPDRDKWNSAIAIAAFWDPDQSHPGPPPTAPAPQPPTLPSGLPRVVGLTINPEVINASDSTTFTVTLDKPAGPGGTMVVFSHITNTGVEDTLVNPPISILMPPGATQASLTVNTRKATNEPTSMVWTAFIGAASRSPRSANLIVR